MVELGKDDFVAWVEGGLEGDGEGAEELGG